MAVSVVDNTITISLATDAAGAAASTAAQVVAALNASLDGSTPTYTATLYAVGGVREDGELLTIPVGTHVHWFSVDSAGNVERNYRPDGRGRSFNKAIARLE